MLAIAGAGMGMQAAGVGAPGEPGYVAPGTTMLRAARNQGKVVPQNLSTELANRGVFDPQFIQQYLDLQKRFAPQNAQVALDVNRQFAPQYLDFQQTLLNQADPNSVAIKDTLGKTVFDELARGRDMTQGQRMSMLDNIRGAQVARGNYTGDSASFDEALKSSRYGDELLQQRLSNAANYLSNVPNKSQMAQGLPSPYAPIDPNSMGGNYRLVDPGAGYKFMGMEQARYGTDASMYNAQLAQPNPWMQGLGMMSGAVAGMQGMRAPTAGAMPMAATPSLPATGGYNAWGNMKY